MQRPGIVHAHRPRGVVFPARRRPPLAPTPRGLFVLEEDDDIDLLERVKEDMKKGMEKRGH